MLGFYFGLALFGVGVKLVDWNGIDYVPVTTRWQKVGYLIASIGVVLAVCSIVLGARTS